MFLHKDEIYPALCSLTFLIVSPKALRSSALFPVSRYLRFVPSDFLSKNIEIHLLRMAPLYSTVIGVKSFAPRGDEMYLRHHKGFLALSVEILHYTSSDSDVDTFAMQ
ncbi:hypothetical protein V6N13_063568 [Hibiscus sabdariffa]|uniref:Uncharacterized protein n=2 Tax=Hibiscus sabdariffa TaxID=183260 RepID=A0ABR2G4N2_9ROSI